VETTSEVNRSTSHLVLMDSRQADRERLQSRLADAGFTDVHACPATPALLREHLRGRNARQPEAVLFVHDPERLGSWEDLRLTRAVYSAGPLIVIAPADARSREWERMGEQYDVDVWFDWGGEGAEALLLKIESVLMAQHVENLVHDNEARIQKMFVNILVVMVRLLESKDQYTRFHSHSVAMWSRMLGRKLGLGEEELIRLGLAAVLHDFGKIAVPEAILNSPKRLTDDEFAVIKQHPGVARDLLSSLEPLSDLMPAILHHHERWDGKGYPLGISGDAIPLWARIIACADSYDTMAGRRTYKDPFPRERIVLEFEKGRGFQFDPRLADLMLELLNEQRDKSLPRTPGSHAEGRG